MVGYVTADGCDQLFDPAVGAGAFFRAALALGTETGRVPRLLGTEIDPRALEEARRSGLSPEDLRHVCITDFVLRPPQRRFKGIVANPPYIRHHRLSGQLKAQLKALAIALVGRPLDGRAGLHVYFLLRALQLLDAGGRLAFIVPADICEGVFANALWDWITSKYRLEAVVTFAEEASPFPGVDTNPIILMISNEMPRARFLWVKCGERETEELKAWAVSGLAAPPGASLSVCERELAEALETGLSRRPKEQEATGPMLRDFARVIRGIATGANHFFFLSAARAAALDLPSEFLVPAIGRTRDVPGDVVGLETLRTLEASGRPTLLFCPDERPLRNFPRRVRDYLRQGELAGLHKRPLIATRRPWYKMEVRPAPPILFAYLGRRNSRFIRNLAGVVPLTGFLCVYPHREQPAFADKLWQVLRHPETISRLSLVGKSYGSGAIKVEPRALERLPLPRSLLSDLGLQSPATPRQLRLPYAR